MRTRAVFALMAMMAGAVHAEPAAKIEDVSWLKGCWLVQRTGGSTEEHWLAPAGGAMLGVSRTLRGDKMTEYEFLSIREVDGKLSYVAIPSGQKETVFPLVRFSPTELVFENPQHDFPQRLIYRKIADGISARAEGTLNGEKRGFDFVFKPCT